MTKFQTQLLAKQAIYKLQAAEMPLSKSSVTLSNEEVKALFEHIPELAEFCFLANA